MAAPVSISPKGLLLGRYLRSLIVAKGDIQHAAAFADGAGPGYREVALALKGAMTAMATGDDGALTTPVAFDFAEALRPQTLIGRIVGTRRVPFNLRLIGTATGAVANWVGEGVATPAMALDLDHTVVLPYTKLASLSVHTQELARSSQPGVEAVLAAECIAAAAQAADLALCDADNAGSASKPAAITHGATAVPSTGSAIDNIDADLRSAIALLTAAGIDLTYAVWLLAPRTATYMATLRGSGGAAAYAGLGPRGGKLLEIPVLTSNAMLTAESPSESSIVLLAASELMLADDGDSRIEVSEQADVQLSTTPTTGAAQMTSMWQHGLAALRAERAVNWQMRHTAGCAYISQVQY